MGVVGWFVRGGPPGIWHQSTNWLFCACLSGAGCWLSGGASVDGAAGSEWSFLGPACLPACLGGDWRLLSGLLACSERRREKEVGVWQATRAAADPPSVCYVTGCFFLAGRLRRYYCCCTSTPFLPPPPRLPSFLLARPLRRLTACRSVSHLRGLNPPPFLAPPPPPLAFLLALPLLLTSSLRLAPRVDWVVPEAEK